MESIDVWTLHSEKKILVTDLPGVPVAACVVEPDTAEKMKDGELPTVSEILFEKEAYRHFDDWNDAMEYAKELATKLGYEVESHSTWDYDDDDDYYGYDYPDDYSNVDEDYNPFIVED